MKKFTIAFTAVMAIALLLTWISVVYAEEETVPLIDTCFASAGYSAGWIDDPFSRDVKLSGKLQPNIDGTCTLSDSLGLEGKVINITVFQTLPVVENKTANAETSSISDDEIGGFFPCCSSYLPDGTLDISHQVIFYADFFDVSDVGEWLITYSFAGDNEYASSEHTFTINVPAPPSEEEEIDIPLETIPEEDFVEVNATGGVEYDVETGEPLVETETIEVVSTQSPADNETLNLRLEILKVLENILAILFGR